MLARRSVLPDAAVGFMPVSANVFAELAEHFLRFTVQFPAALEHARSALAISWKHADGAPVAVAEGLNGVGVILSAILNPDGVTAKPRRHRRRRAAQATASVPLPQGSLAPVHVVGGAA